MINEIFLAIIQAATEFLPVSSSGHLAFFGNLISEPNLFFITILHFASLLAVLIFTRKELCELVIFKKDSRKMWIYLIIATIPAVIVGLLFKTAVQTALSNYLFLGAAFIFTGLILLLTKFFKGKGKINLKSSLLIGLFQALALFPGVSRSGMTISAGMFSGVERKKATKFSFLLLIPLVLGAMVLEIGKFYFSWSLLISFLVCFVLSLFFLNLLYTIISKGYFWGFGIYCFLMGILSWIIYFFGII